MRQYFSFKLPQLFKSFQLIKKKDHPQARRWLNLLMQIANVMI